MQMDELERALRQRNQARRKEHLIAASIVAALVLVIALVWAVW